MFARFRLSEPWRYKAPFLISIVYFYLYVNSMRFSDSLLAVICSLVGIAGFAGVGYLSNDVSDRESDLKSGKPNATAGLSSGCVILLFGFFVACAVLPWFLFVPVNRTWWMLVVLELLLFVLYAVPPIRLKERGLLGLVTDSLYAHANPALLAAYTMHLATGKRYSLTPWLMASLFGWQFFLGLRNIMQHQITDAVNDRKAGTATWVTRSGERASAGMLRTFIVPGEVFGFAVWLVIVSADIPAAAIVFLIHAACTALVIRRYSGRLRNQQLHEMLVFFLDDFFVGWMPLVILAGLCIWDWRMAVLLLLHVTIFRDRLGPLFRFWLRALREFFSELPKVTVR